MRNKTANFIKRQESVDGGEGSECSLKEKLNLVKGITTFRKDKL